MFAIKFFLLSAAFFAAVVSSAGAGAGAGAGLGVAVLGARGTIAGTSGLALRGDAPTDDPAGLGKGPTFILAFSLPAVRGVPVSERGDAPKLAADVTVPSI